MGIIDVPENEPKRIADLEKGVRIQVKDNPVFMGDRRSEVVNRNAISYPKGYTDTLISGITKNHPIWVMGDGGDARLSIDEAGFWSLSGFLENLEAIIGGQTTNISIVDETSYPRVGKVDSSSYNIVIDPAWTIKDVLVFDSPKSGTFDFTTTDGDSVSDVDFGEAKFNLGTYQIDSITFKDPQGTGTATKALYGGE